MNATVGGGGGGNWTWGTNGVKVQTMDIDGDGLPDRVLTVEGSGGTRMYVRRNQAGLLNRIEHPQGGRTELEYRLAPSTREMPQAKQVLSRVTRSDESGKKGLTDPAYESVHEYVTEFEYRNGHYDRVEKEHYGFEQVYAYAPDGTETLTVYHWGAYRLKGMPVRRQMTNSRENWTTRTEQFYVDHETQALVRQTRTTVTEGGGSIESRVEYGYDGYGNVTTITDTAEGVPALKAVIGHGNEAKYFHAHPASITVTSGGEVIRERTGEYDGDTGALVRQTAYDGRAPGRGSPVTTEIHWDSYGNLKRIANGAWVEYGYDGTHRQYPERITRGGQEVPKYESGIEWDYRLGVKVKEVDENGEEIRYGYDRYGRLLEVYGPYDGTTPAVRYRYEAPEGGNRYAVTENKVSFDPADGTVITTVIVADGLGRALVTGKTGAVRRDGTDVTGWNVSGGVAYDEKGRTVRQGQPDFLAVPDPDHNDGIELLRGWRGSLKNPTGTEYDTQDRPVLVRLPDGSEQRTGYGISGGKSVVTATDPLGNVTVQEADARGNITAVRRYDKDRHLLTQASYRYNAIGELRAAVDAEGGELLVEYDRMGRRTAMESPDIGRKEYDYDRYGNLSRESDSVLRGKGTFIGYQYDGLNRLIKIDYPESADTAYEYGEPGAPDGRANRITKVTDETGSTEYRYGKLGETAEEKRMINHVMAGQGESRTRTIGYTSNYLGQLERIIHDDGEIISYGYNAGGQIRTVTGHKESTDGTGEFGYVKDVGYDEFGQRVVMEYGNGVRTEYSYNPERRWLERIVTVDGTGTRLQNITYDINPVGNVRGYENAADGYSTKQTYGYDNLYQLVKVDGESKNYQAGSGLVTMSSAYSQVFSFDGAGNGKLVGKASSERTMGTRNGDNLNYSLQYRYYAGTHKAEQIGEMYYRYDGNGNLVSERFGGHAVTTANNAQVYEEDGIYSTDYGFGLVHPEAGQGERRAYQRDYRWNERNLLSRSVDDSYRVEYRYGGDGERAIKYSLHASIEGETLYFNKFFQTDYSSGRGGWLESKHVFVGETRIATKRRTEGNTGNYGEENKQLYYYHGDHLGSAQMVTDPEGKIYEQLEYTPYGELWVEHVPVVEATPFRFTGKERDGETGLYYYGARYLNPQTSMWLSADPAMGEYIPQAPINDEAKQHNKELPGMGGVFNYVNLHVYHYAGNNPVKLVDPDGRDSFGFELLTHYLYGGGKELLLDNKKWANYMKANLMLETQIKLELNKYAIQHRDFSSHDFIIRFHAEIDTGENIDGYQYLHGTNRDVGDFELRGSMIRNDDGTITFNYTAQWNDKIDPNYTYATDREKEKIAKIISFGKAKGYIVRIKWDDTMTITPRSPLQIE